MRLNEALDDAVLQRVEADDGQPPAGGKYLGSSDQAGFQRLELVVDGDPQRLENAGGRMQTATLSAHSSFDRREQIYGPGKGAPASSLDNHSGKPARASLLAVLV